MGKSGDQDIHWAQNATLAESDYNGVDVHLFEVIDAGEYIYCGRIELISKPYIDVQPSEDGNDRKVWMFPIRPVPDNDVKKPQMFVFKDMDDYENRGENVDVEYTKMMAAAKKEGVKKPVFEHGQILGAVVVDCICSRTLSGVIPFASASGVISRRCATVLTKTA